MVVLFLSADPNESTLTSLLTFESVKDAQKAKLALNGADIYAGCCTLKIEYARVNTCTYTHTLMPMHMHRHLKRGAMLCCPFQPNRLNVICNNNTSWDYTKPFLLHRGSFPSFNLWSNKQTHIHTMTYSGCHTQWSCSVGEAAGFECFFPIIMNVYDNRA